ncbi:MAG: DNA topoisomerase I [Nanoarchaeota archaeon]|nr:DNA topoisomerase I [Nanoarchaeota archaeon]
MAKRKFEKENNYVPLDKDDLKRALEIPVKNVDESTLIKIDKKGKKTKIGKLKTRNIEEEVETIDKLPIIKGDYEIIISEKPQASEKIACALGSPKKRSERGVSYYELERGGRKIIVACAVGHLFNLKSEEKGWPIFKIDWEPSFKLKNNTWSKKYYDLLKKLCKNAKEFVVATDYDIEGEVIGLNILRFLCKKKDAKRMKFSTLTKAELEESYKNLEKTINWGNAIAGETRHFLDWMYGINLSRALMESIKKVGSFKIMSSGRVQGPSLDLIVNRELEIKKFKPKPYWQIFIKLKGHDILLKYIRDIKDKKELEKFKDLKNKEGIAETKKEKRNLAPPVPFDLTSLQREAYRLYKITPSRTLQVAQSLYLDGLISYPRTSSQKIPEAINPKKILEKLKSVFKEVKYAVRSSPIEGGKSDPAHPSIYPTGEIGKLSGEKEKMYNIIRRRFISCFCEDLELEDKKILFVVDNLKFNAKGLEILNKGWLNVYPAIIEEKEIEDINGKKKIEKLNIEEKETRPPKRFTPASIITELEKRNLGTKATRAGIIETLYSRNYIKEQSIRATSLGISLISILKKYSPIIIDEKLTRHFEKEMQAIQDAKKNILNLQDQTIKEAKKTLIKISEDFKKNEEKIGKGLVKATKEGYKEERKENTLEKCGVCKKGNLRIIYNPRFKRSFIGCSGYPECRTTYPLPPGAIKKTDKVCDKCGFPLLMRLMKGKRPWIFCFNKECESRKEEDKEKAGYKKNYKHKKLLK